MQLKRALFILLFAFFTVTFSQDRMYSIISVQKYQWHSLKFKFSSDRNDEIVYYIPFLIICVSCVIYMDKFICVFVQTKLYYESL